MKKRVYKRLINRQKFYGIILLIISAIFILMAVASSSSYDKDCTPAIILIPLGIYLIFTKQVVIC